MQIASAGVCGARIHADLNEDSLVNGVDLDLLLDAWGANEGHPADFDGDGHVTASDLAYLLGHWGDCRPCRSDADCDDTLFCNGNEFCDEEGLCQAGEPPCQYPPGFPEDCPSLCLEELNSCGFGLCSEDSDCDDTLFCNGDEICNECGLCQSGEPPCKDCNEQMGCSS